MLKIRRPLGRLIFNMGIAIPGKTVFLIEMAPWCWNRNIPGKRCQYQDWFKSGKIALHYNLTRKPLCRMWLPIRAIDLNITKHNHQVRYLNTTCLIAVDPGTKHTQIMLFAPPVIKTLLPRPTGINHITSSSTEHECTKSEYSTSRLLSKRNMIRQKWTHMVIAYNAWYTPDQHCDHLGWE